jgi:hypothetical protein
MARKESFSVGELEVDSITGGGAGIQAWRKKIYLNAALGSDFNDGVAFDRPVKTLAVADDKITTLYKDCIVLEESASAISLGAAYDWTYSMCGLIGTAQNRLNQRSRIGMSTTFTPMLTVSGYGNQFANLYTMHGTEAGDYVGWLISGARNSFDNVHFGGPMVAAQGGHASYNGVSITGSENHFSNCVFGTNTIPRDELTPNVTLGAGTITMFDDCTFLCALTDTDPYFIAVTNTTGYTQAYFNRCKFIAFSASQANKAAVAFTFSAGYSADMVLDAGCTFAGVTKLAASASMKYIWMPTVFAATTDELNLIAINSATY